MLSELMYPASFEITAISLMTSSFTSVVAFNRANAFVTSSDESSLPVISLI